MFLQINIGVAKLKDSGSVGSSKCVVYDNVIKCKLCIRKPICYVFRQLVKWQAHEIVGHYCHFIFFGKQYSYSQMKNNPESGEFCCLHICLFKVPIAVI